MNPPGPPPPFEISELEIGGGQSDGSGFVQLTNGTDVTLVSGAQGGFHVWVNARFDLSGATPLPTSVVFERQARLVSTQELVSTTKETRDVIRSPDRPDRFEIERAMPMFLCPAPAGIRIEDQRLVLRVRAMPDEESKTPIAEGTIELVPHCPTGDLAALCARICAG